MKVDHKFDEIISLIAAAKEKAVFAVNYELIGLYWSIGNRISFKMSTAEWGDGVVNRLSDYIIKNIPDVKGFSPQNLWRMKQFYETYNKNEKLSALVRELSWTNNLMILSKSTTEQEREFYIRLSINEKYSSRELERQIDSALYERVVLSNGNLSAVLREIHPKSTVTFSDNYVLDFLSLPKSHSEKDLRKKIVQHLKEFILEFGRDFAFISEEYRLSVGNKDFYIDLLFFHRDLQCLVAIDLKITDFKPEYLGKMEFYLEALDNDVKKEHERPSVGLILCKNKDTKVVEYAMNRTMSPTMVSKYVTELMDKHLLERKLDEFFQLESKKE